MSLVATIEALVRTGATPEMILEVVRVQESAREDAISRRRASDAARQQKARKNKGVVPTDTIPSRDITLHVDGHADTSPRAHVVNTTSSLRSEGNTPPNPNGLGSPKPKSKAPAAPRLRMAPQDWSPSVSVFAVGEKVGFNPGEIERELSQFRDHEFRDPHSDWDAAARKWLRNAAKFNPPGGPSNGQRPDPNAAKLAARAAVHEADFLGAQIAADDWRRQRGHS